MAIFKIPTRISEANIQAEFYHQCKLATVKCYLEYTLDNCRFDAIIYNESNEIVFIVEFKSYKTFKPEITSTKQIEKYKKHGIQIIMISRIEHVFDVVKKIKHVIYG